MLPHHIDKEKAHIEPLIQNIRHRIAMGQSKKEIYEAFRQTHDLGELHLCYSAAMILEKDRREESNE